MTIREAFLLDIIAHLSTAIDRLVKLAPNDHPYTQKALISLHKALNLRCQLLRPIDSQVTAILAPADTETTGSEAQDTPGAHE
jgi:hypothetical protein